MPQGSTPRRVIGELRGETRSLRPKERLLFALVGSRALHTTSVK
ncbi:hypothetical protein Pla52n_15690 [Stieleria varia]|uniref:Uncharacterized protein n=1 Tax=Stieleria varia TaxID=2528005 RepID=A0A5C6B5S4_9BACT|nr:hypothetical protein Pla52n_15690 [Stieleria varia]